MANKNTIKTPAKLLMSGDKLGNKVVNYVTPMDVGFVKVFFKGELGPMQVDGNATFEVERKQLVAVASVHVSESDCYEVRGAEPFPGTIEVSDFTVIALVDNVGLKGPVAFRHASFKERGWFRNEDGFSCPNFRAEELAKAFAAKVQARGRIDLRHWVPCCYEDSHLDGCGCDRRTLAERWADDAAEEQMERMGH